MTSREVSMVQVSLRGRRTTAALATVLMLLSVLTGCGSSAHAGGTSHEAGRGSTVPGGSASEAAGEMPGGGHLVEARVTGAHSHHTAQVDVWTPPGYDQHRSASWPVLLALHGWPGTPRMIYHNVKLLRTLTEVTGAHQVAWPVVVMPQWGDVDTECTDADAQHLSETFLTVDLPAWLHQHYRVRSGAQNWATYGYSAGAYCASMLALRHPTQFGAAISMSGYARPSFEQPYVPFAPDSELGRRYDLATIASTRRPAVALYELTDTADRESYPSLKNLLAAVKAPTRLTTVYGTGGHAVALWIPADAKAFAWLGQTLTGFRAG